MLHDFGRVVSDFWQLKTFDHIFQKHTNSLCLIQEIITKKLKCLVYLTHRTRLQETQTTKSSNRTFKKFPKNLNKEKKNKNRWQQVLFRNSILQYLSNIWYSLFVYNKISDINVCVSNNNNNNSINTEY